MKHSFLGASIIAAPSSTKNKSGTRNPEMRQRRNSNQWNFGMKAHIGVDADSGLVHALSTAPAYAHDVTEAHQGTDPLQGGAPVSSVQAQFGRIKARYQGLKKNTRQLYTLFALANLWMARRRILQQTSE